MQPESFMFKHQEDRHNGAAATFEAKVVSSYQDCLSRQISEGVQIRRSKNMVLNSNAEWHQPALWKVQSELCREWWENECGRAQSIFDVSLDVTKQCKYDYWYLISANFRHFSLCVLPNCLILVSLLNFHKSSVNMLNNIWYIPVTGEN